MKKSLLLIILSFTISCYAQQTNFMPNQVLVQLEQGIDAGILINQVADVTIIEAELISRPLNIWLLKLEPSSISENEAVTKLYTNSNVLVAQKNHKVTFRSTEPDDPLFPSQWQYKQNSDGDIDADEAWDITTGGLTANGDIIVAAALDDGIDINHEDFEDNLWTNEAEIPDNDVDDDDNGYVDDYLGWNIVSDDDNISGGSHGTPVAGIIGAKGNNGIGVSGVNWDVKVMIIKNNFNTNEAQVIEAYSYALEARILYNDTEGAEGAFVVSTNASWGVDFGDPNNAPLWCGLYDTLGENGILSCGATINGNFDVDIVGDLPTACPSEYLITVTNMNSSDTKVTNAGYGAETIDLGAHGAGVINTRAGNSYGGFGGTSGATPHVTGAIALLYSAPCKSFADLATSDPAEAARQVRDYILEGVDPNPSLEGITTTGGRLNLFNSVSALMDECQLLSTQNFSGNQFVTIYPNPSNDIITILSNSENNLNSVVVYGMDGKIVMNKDKFNNNTIDISSLANGAYIIQLYFDGQSTTHQKLFIKK